jgi:hypothetical protein
MIPPKIKQLPKLRKKVVGYISKPQASSKHSNRDLYMGGAKMVK